METALLERQLMGKAREAEILCAYPGPRGWEEAELGASPGQFFLLKEKALLASEFAASGLGGTVSTMPVQHLISYRMPPGISWLLWSEIKLEGRKARAVGFLTGDSRNQDNCLLVRQLSLYIQWFSWEETR